MRETLPTSRLRPVLRGVVRTVIRPALSARTPTGLQRAWIRAVTATTLKARGTRIEAFTLGGVAGERVLPRDAGGDRAVLYLHGGGYVFGSAATHRAITTHLAAASGATVYAPNYRLAPEHACPAAVDDCLAAYRGLLASGVAAGRIVIAGDSAGGGLALATALAARAASVALPGGLILVSPWVDASLQGETIDSNAARDPMLHRSFMEKGARLYLNGLEAVDLQASPLFADLAGLPPMCIQVGSDEVLLADAERLAERAQAAGVQVDLTVYNGLWHDFHLHAGLLPEATTAINALGAFARDVFAKA